MISWQKRQIYGEGEKSIQNASNHQESQDNKYNQNYSEPARSKHHYE